MPQHPTRRTLIAAGASALALPALAQPQPSPAPDGALAPNPAALRKAMADFTQGRQPLAQGLELDIPSLADNPGSVPVKVKVTLPISEQDWCEEIIILADLNPAPLACRVQFSAAAGTAEAAVRLRLAQSQTVHALARMSSGKLLAARQPVTVIASGCGM